MHAADLRRFAPRRARVVGLALSALVFIACVVIAVLIPNAPDGDPQLSDRLSIMLVGLALGWTCYRQATVAATPTAQGVVVRNWIITRRVAWSEIESVQMVEGEAWARLHLRDGDEVAVMAIQRADGDAAFAEARRLRRLFEQYADQA
ncbi:PH domain-containing protein [Micrococcales bacterium 31B]|nr:PH domain-containing protein [Micrococcales bacterium 31B]